MGLEFRNVSHAYGRDKVLDGISLAAGHGEVTCLLGPSGCGKTTLLKLAVGLMPLQAGEITLDETSLARPGASLPPEKRPVGLVFQEGALFPHLTVAENIAFGLTGDPADKKDKVTQMLHTIGLEAYGDRYPHTLSGGQQQRVALARALVPAPKVLLLDEPFANIDGQLRRGLREETRRILKESGTAAILVTHDPEEALEMGDRIAIMERGSIVQCATPQALYDRPATASVARMFGRGQPVHATLTDAGDIETEFGIWPSSCLATEAPSGGVAQLIVRQDIFDLAQTPGAQRIIDIRNAGQEQLVFIEGSDGTVLRVEIPRRQNVHIGDTVGVNPRAASVFCYPPAG